MALPVVGYNGNVKVGTHALANFSKWTLSGPKVATDKTTPFQAPSGFEVNTPTLISWQATVEGWTDETDTLGQVALMNGVGTVYTLELDTSASHKWLATTCALMTQIDQAADASKVETLKFTFIGTAPIVWS